MDLAQSPGAVGTRSDVQPVLKMETVLVALLETHMRTPSKAIPIGTETLGPEAKGLPETWLPSRLKTETSFDPPLTTHMCFPSNPRAQGPPPAANGLPGICVPSALNTETVCAAALASREWTSQNLSSVDDGCRFWHFERGFGHFGTESQIGTDSGTRVAAQAPVMVVPEKFALVRSRPARLELDRSASPSRARVPRRGCTTAD